MTTATPPVAGTAALVAKSRGGQPSEAQTGWQAGMGRLLGVEFTEGATRGWAGTPAALPRSGTTGVGGAQVEQKHTHPAENVLQYWPWIERNRRRVVLVHAIAPEPAGGGATARTSPAGSGAMMERVLPDRFAYRRLELGSADEADQLTAAKAAIVELESSAPGTKLAPGL